MFKRLSKSRRHSADDVALSLSSPAQEETLLEPALTARDNAQGVRASWSKHSRRSCSDATTMQAFLAQKQQDQGRNDPHDPHDAHDAHDADYQMVTAVPAFIVEHEPDKQRVSGSSFGVWSRRMSKKIDSFRRSGSRETICPASERIDVTNSLNKNYTNNDVVISNNNNNNNNNKNLPVKPSGLSFDPKTEEKVERRFSGVSQRSPSPFKSFFIRMGSTGMLNSARINRRSQNIEDRLKSPEKENLFRSCSTSQLNTSPTYVKGDDPSEGIDLQIASRKDKTVSCDDLAATVHRDHDDVFDVASCDVSPSIPYTIQGTATSFNPCDFSSSRIEPSMRKSNSCDFKETKKSSFPYAFLRSKLSVLPEERHGPFASKDERLFKTASEEHFPALKIEESYNGTTTLGRRRVKNANVFGRCQEAAVKSRTSQPELRRTGKTREQDICSASQLETTEDTGCYSPFDSSPMSLRGANVLHPIDGSHERMDLSGRSNEFRLGETTSLSMELEAMASLRSQRRNSAPSGEQRLSSHYVSSNESGYDSDGPRGESVGPSENDGLKCTTDSSDTSSLIDSEIEKPIRSSTPSESSQDSHRIPIGNRELTNHNDGIDGLRWHQSNSGRLLPSIHQTSFDESPALDFSGRVNTPVSTEGDNVGKFAGTKKALDSTALHRARLQQDKSRFLNDIVQPPKRVRRCRLVQLHKRDPKENLGIRLAQQRTAELRYIVVQLEPDGIAHRDGRLRLGDEIVEVEGQELRTLESLEEVQEFLKSFTGNRIRLMTAYEETVPLVYVSPNGKNGKNRNNNGSCGNTNSLPAEHEYLENAKNLSNMSLIDNPTKRASPGEQQPLTKEIEEVAEQSSKRPDFLPLSCLAKDRRSADNSFESMSESQHYLTRHITKFEKGYGKPSLGFSVVGGRDSPRGEMGIFVRRVFPGGQADVSKLLQQGDEILSLNGKVLRGHTHQEVIELFKAVREGPIELEIARRHRYPRSALKSAPC